MDINNDNEYRKGVVGIIRNTKDEYLIVNLINYKSNEWSFPGGGKEENESYEGAVFREIKEEVNIDKQDLILIGQSKLPLKYNFPKELIESNKKIGRNFIGQIKQQFLLELKNNDVNIKLQKSEINKYIWVQYEDLYKYLIFFNLLENTLAVIKEFAKN